jgi:hypothetical protein
MAASEAKDEAIGNHVVQEREAPGRTNENVFLFVPNLIGPYNLHSSVR